MLHCDSEKDKCFTPYWQGGVLLWRQLRWVAALCPILESHHCKSIEGRISVDFSCGYQMITAVAVTWQGRQGIKKVVHVTTDRRHALLAVIRQLHMGNYNDDNTQVVDVVYMAHVDISHIGIASMSILVGAETRPLIELNYHVMVIGLGHSVNQTTAAHLLRWFTRDKAWRSYYASWFWTSLNTLVALNGII